MRRERLDRFIVAAVTSAQSSAASFLLSRKQLRVELHSRICCHTLIAFILVVLDLTDPGSIYETPQYRLYEIISGVVAAWLCARVLRPSLGLSSRSKEIEAISAGSSIKLTRSELRMLIVVGGSVPVITTLLWSWFHLPSLVQAIVTGNNPPDTIGPVIGRIAGMTGGVFVVGCVCFVLNPDPEDGKIHRLRGLHRFKRLEAKPHTKHHI